MAQEMGLLLKTERFTYQGYSYPLNFVCFEDPKKLGFFDPSCMQLGLNYKLMLQARDEIIDNILKHELAHLLTYLRYPKTFNDLEPHGKEYKEVCRELSWSEEIYSARANIEKENLELSQLNQSAKKFEQIKKLLALASSSNEHESMAATLKANQLLRKYNLEKISKYEQQEDVSYVKTVLIKKKNGPILTAIYDIISHFYVKPVFSKRNGEMALEVVGQKESVELADYIAKFLNNELERFWVQVKKHNKDLRGTSAKRNYIKGVSAGFIDKISQDKSKTMTREENALISRSLDHLVGLAYPKLRHTQINAGKSDLNALKKGFKDGKELSIRQGVTSSNQTKLLL